MVAEQDESELEKRIDELSRHADAGKQIVDDMMAAAEEDVAKDHFKELAGVGDKVYEQLKRGELDKKKLALIDNRTKNVYQAFLKQLGIKVDGKNARESYAAMMSGYVQQALRPNEKAELQEYIRLGDPVETARLLKAAWQRALNQQLQTPWFTSFKALRSDIKEKAVDYLGKTVTGKDEYDRTSVLEDGDKVLQTIGEMRMKAKNYDL